MRSTNASGFVLLFLIVLSGAQGCSPAQSPPTQADIEPWSANARSLLTIPPLIGEEVAIRESPPTPGKLTIEGECVNGWLVPPERVLRFPVQLAQDSMLSMRIGISLGSPGLMAFRGASPPGPGRGPMPPPPPPGGFQPPEPVRPPLNPPGPGDIDLSVEFVPDDSAGDANPVEIYRLPPEDIRGCLNEWHSVNISMGQPGPVSGELRLVASGPMAGNPDVQVLWGQPAIYSPVSRPKRNVLLIGIDTLRADALSPYGARPEVTPRLQAFSESATLFKQVRSQAPWTLPSFASMITGLMPTKGGATGTNRGIPEATTTLGEMALPYGYATFTVCSVPWLGSPSSGFQQGMETLVFLEQPLAQIQVERAEKFILESMDRDWVCFIHIMDPHAPYEPPERFRDMLCDPDYPGEFHSGYEGGDVRLEPGVISPEEEIRQVKNLYEAEVANVDAAMSDLFDFLDENGLTDETLIVFCSDHGEEFCDHDGFGHGLTQYDEAVHVPLIIKGAGFPEGLVVDASVANIDIVPSILRFLEIPQPDELTGIPLQDVVTNDDGMNERVIFGEETTPQSRNPLAYSLRWPYKCVFNLINHEAELYDLAADPAETIDVRDDHPEHLSRLVTDIATLVRPKQSAFHCMVLINQEEEVRTFRGTLTVPGGIQSVQAFLLGPQDSYTVSGDTLTFSISTGLDQAARLDLMQFQGITLPPMPIKHLMLVPSDQAATMDVEVSTDGDVGAPLFFPYGTDVPEYTGSVSLPIDSFPLAPYLPPPEARLPSSLLIWGIRGIEENGEAQPMDPQTIEQLRALGYIVD